MKLLITSTILWLLSVGFSDAQQNGVAQEWRVEPHDIYELGSAKSRQYLVEKQPEFSKSLDDIFPWVVRVQVEHTFSRSAHVTNHGTGVILPGGYVITCRHVLEQNVKENGRVRVKLVLPQGRILRAEVVDQGEQDWSRLKILGVDSDDPVMSSPMRLAEPVANETTVFLGYPARMGLDTSGKIRWYHPWRRRTLVPTVSIFKTSNVNKMDMELVAGFPTVGGMSGGPVLNLDGQVVGIQFQISKTQENVSGRIIRRWINSVSASVIKSKLLEKNSESENK